MGYRLGVFAAAEDAASHDAEGGEEQSEQFVGGVGAHGAAGGRTAEDLRKNVGVFNDTRSLIYVELRVIADRKANGIGVSFFNLIGLLQNRKILIVDDPPVSRKGIFSVLITIIKDEVTALMKGLVA